MTTELQEYQESLRKAVMHYVAGNEVPLLEHCERFQIGGFPAHPRARKGAVMKLITASTSYPMEMRTNAKRWLLANGFEPWDDGDVPS